MNIKKHTKSIEKISPKSNGEKSPKNNGNKFSKSSGEKSPKSSKKKSPKTELEIGQRIIVKPCKFTYLKEPDYVINIVVDNRFIYDYKTGDKINLDNYTIGIILDDGFIPIQNFLILKRKGSIYETNNIQKIKYKKSFVKYPKTEKGKEKFKISIDKKNKISPSKIVAKVINIDIKKKFIDLSIKKYYSYIE